MSREQSHQEVAYKAVEWLPLERLVMHAGQAGHAVKLLGRSGGYTTC